MKRKIITLCLMGGVAATLAVFGVRFSQKLADVSVPQATEYHYGITLDAANRYTSGTSKQIETDFGESYVTFAYSGASVSSGHHVSLAKDGYLTNTDKITSIASLQVTFSGALQARLSFDSTNWSKYFTLESGTELELSKPYFIEIKAKQATVIDEVVYKFTCQPNEEAESSGGGLLGVIDFWDSSKVDNTSSSTVVNLSYVSNASYASVENHAEKRNLVCSVDASAVYQGRYGGIGFGSSNNAGTLTLGLANGARVSKVVVEAARTSTSGSLTLNSTSKSLTKQWSSSMSGISSSTVNTLTWEFSSAVSSLSFSAGGSKSTRVALYRIYLYSSVAIPETPAGLPDAYTVMLYLCGSDLESGGYYASSDLNEILRVTGQPDDVNIIIQTGGSTKWKSSTGINAAMSQRWHVENQALVLDQEEARVNMGLASTFQSFIEWGLTEYPAEKTGVILWNHGGAMDGCCFDSNYNDDSLTNSETNTALSAAFSNLGRTEKLEWIGYDCCLMAVQDIAEVNSHYFNYMVSSEETEAGDGWDYDGGWLGQLYADPSGIETTTLLTSICDTFIADNYSEATLSVLDLTVMDAYKTAWENMAKGLKGIITSQSKWNSFANVVNACKRFGYYADYSSYNNGYVYDVFDAKDLITKLSSNSTYSGSLSTQLSTLSNAFDNLVVCSKYTSDYAGSHGMTFFCPLCGINSKSCYSETQTAFTNWRSLCISYGSWGNY